VTALAVELPLPRRRTTSVLVSLAARRLAFGALVLVAIAFLTYWGLTMAEHAVASLPVEPAASAVEAARLTVAHFLDHPTTYIVHRVPVSPWVYITTLLRNSLILLVPALLLAFGAGVSLGMRAARAHTRSAGSLIWLISLLGVSVPAFMLAMFLWVINLEVSRRFNLTPLPATGLGVDQHLLLPVLVLAARPFAVLTQVTYITITGLLTQDFVRTARGKGMTKGQVDWRHVMRNAWIPVLTALATSLRFSLATLPIVEYFFVWPGIGLGLLEAIIAGEKAMAVDMVLALGVVFVIVNVALEAAYPLLDPRMRETGGTTETVEQVGLHQAILEWFGRQRDRWRRRRIADRYLKEAERGEVLSPPSGSAPGLSTEGARPSIREQMIGHASAPAWVRTELRQKIQQAKIALGNGDKAAARRLARGAVRLDPYSEAAWLTLAATSEPRSALAYASRALEINPSSQPARRAIQWAVHQLPPPKRRLAPREVQRPIQPAAISTPAKPARPRRLAGTTGQGGEASRGWQAFTDPVFLVAGVLVAGLILLAVFGSRMTETSPYVAHGVMIIEGEIGAPPYPPSSTFPWGTDKIGRDMQALVLSGARQTLTLALLVVGARLVVGVLTGLIAGWWKGGLFDRFVNGVLSVWAAFPITLFAMILILAIGIERGMPTFVLALCFVGWGEIAQYIRSEVIALRGKPFLEGARAVGVPPEDVLRRHILPNLAPSILVLASLEMGAVLLILAELGFLSIFLGGGYRVMIGEVGQMVPVIAFYSDVPEWGALLANVRQWWRGYPWLAWSPAVAFSLAILTFNLAGEGMRRVLERSRISPIRWINRASLAGVAILGIASVWIFNTTAPLGEYRSQANRFQVGRVQATIEELAGPAYAGRESGTDGAKAAADYLAREMDAIGLFPGGDRETFVQTQAAPRMHLMDVPKMRILHDSGEVEELTYRVDFAEFPYGRPPEEPVRGRVVGVAAGPLPAEFAGDPYGIGRLDLEENVLIVPERMAVYLPGRAMAATLVVPESPERLHRRYLYPGTVIIRNFAYPLGDMMFVHPDLADRLLAGTGATVESLRQVGESLPPGGVGLTGPGAEVELELHVEVGEAMEEKYYNVIGYIAGEGAEMGMDDDVIMVSAYYDGLGMGPEGVLYPGANDNLSGVGMMLELARVLKEGPYAPDKTVVFVAWSGGERWEGFSVVNAMSAKIGFNLLNVEAVLELTGVGGGSGEAIALGAGTSFRLTQLIEAAAGRVGAEVTTRGTDPHFGLPTSIGHGTRDALSAFISWDGSDQLAHLPLDDPARIEPEKMEEIGETLALVLTVLSREAEY
jgi:ABC-type dipeptide/oligopeptide/nickel transport system permease subunit